MTLQGFLGECKRQLRGMTTTAVIVATLLACRDAQAFTLNVVDGQGAPVTVPFRWMLEEDNTVPSVPGVPVNNSIGLVIHKSHAPVAANGSASSPATIAAPDAAKRYFLSILAEGYQVGAASVATNQASVTVVLNKHKIPTAQITFVAFVDHDRINNAIDETDPPLGGVKIVIDDAILGPVEFDAFGNPLGTRYQKDPGTGEYLEDADGMPIVETMGSGRVYTLTQREFDLGGVHNPDNLKVGEAIIKNLPPGKYGTIAIPPAFDDAGNPVKWIQTTTIEGTPVIDAWVAANEPAYFVEGFGTGFKHVAQGFIKLSPIGPSVINGKTISTLPWNTQWPTGGTATVRGTLRLNHFSKPPNNQGYFPGSPVPEGWIGLNDPNAQPEVTPGGLFAMPCNPETGYFEINNLPAGQYQLVTWDKPLINLFGVNAAMPANQATFTITAGQTVDLGDVLCFRWFGAMEGSVFYDTNENGFPDTGEAGIPMQNVNLRFRNGVMYQTAMTKLDGAYEFAEVFPFFKWLITEVDFARYKPTGMTAVIDEGGQIPPEVPGDFWAMPSEGVRNPQPQYATDPVTGVVDTNSPVLNPNTGNNLSRTEVGPVLLQAQHLFLNQNNRVDWGKVAYKPGENGGISGVTGYQTTRAENDPRLATNDPWEPGIPRVQVVLYDDSDVNQVIDDLDGSGGVTLADVDNYPVGWATGGAKGPEDVDHNGNNTFDTGDARQVVWSDSWDDVAEANPTLGAIQTHPPVVHGKAIIGCDNYSTWNQVRPEVFDGGYAFVDLPAGMYIVQACPPPGYLIQTEESFNVVFGDAFKPSQLALLPELVGTRENHGGAAGDAYAASIVAPTRTDPYTVPPYLSLFPDQAVDAAFAGQVRPLADMKWVHVDDVRNTAADFHLYTEVPKAGRGVGFVLNDLGAEFNQASPNFGEKLAAPWLPISIRDWAGTEVSRVYSDEYGTYNFLVPSTYSAHVPMPAGVSASMMTIVLNDPLLPDGTVDPYYNPMYVTSPWTFHYMPGGLSYLDTPIVPQAAFTTAEKRIDTEPADHEPVIREVNGPEGSGASQWHLGPWIRRSGGNNSFRRVRITAMGSTPVINPDYDSNVPGSTMYVVRDYGFGTTQGSVTLAGVNLSVVSWSASQIVASVPNNAPTGEILVTRGDNSLSTQLGVTFHSVDNNPARIHQVPSEFASIQAAIDSPLCKAGDLVLVAPGVYNENVIMNKPVHLQGYGAGSTTIYGNPIPMQRLQTWHDRINALGGAELAVFLMKDPFQQNEAPCVLVCGEIEFANGTLQIQTEGTQFFNKGNPFTQPGQAQVDGFTLLGSKAGGAVFVVCGASHTQLSNLNAHGNQGGDAGAIAIGTQDVGFDSLNKNIVIHRNRCHRNSGIAGGGAISVNEASDNYVVEDNLMTGNFTRDNGAAFKHWGYCGGTNIIRRNKIRFNENMYAALLNNAGDGGGLYIAGDVAGGTGAGHVIVDGNLIQGNMTGSGKGAGICVFAFNGEDVTAAPTTPNAWYQLQIINNLIVNNVAAYDGGGITIEDAVRATIVHNTIANNDSTATSSLLHGPGQPSVAQGAGIVVHNLSAPLAAALGSDFRSPTIMGNILWHNRSYAFDPTLNANAGGLAPNPAGLYQDLAVSGTTGTLAVTHCLFSETGAYPGTGNTTTANPQFVLSYVNTLETATVIDEGGNNVNIRFLPITPTGNYHLTGSSPAVNAVTAGTAYLDANPLLHSDPDGQWRPYGAQPDKGADEYSVQTVTAAGDFYSVSEGNQLQQVAPGVLSNDSGPGTLQAVLITRPAHGTLTFNYSGQGSFRYQPAADFYGVDSFTYRARVGSAYSKAVQVLITVNPANDAPTAVLDTYSVNGNGSLTVAAPGLLANDSDRDGDALTVARATGPLAGPFRGTLSALGADGSFTYTPNPGARGTDLFLYILSDGQATSLGTVRITITAARADFVVTAVALNPQPVRTGDPMTATVTVRNQGTVTGNAGRLSVWRNRGGPDVAPGTSADSFATLGSMGVGATTSVVFNLTAPPLPAPVENQLAPIFFRAYVNSLGTQTEFTQANNQTSLWYTVVAYGKAFAALPADTDGVDTDGDGNVSNDVAYVHLAGGDGFARMADGVELYTFGFSDFTALTHSMIDSHPDDIRSAVMREGMLKANVSAPTLVLKEGQRFYIDLSNVGMIMRPDLFDPHTLHFHGYPQAASIFDGEPFASVAINPGGTFRYFYQVNEPGTFLYHCHMEATEHMEMGMLGSLYVMPKQNNLPAGTPLARLPASKGPTHQAGYRYAYNDGDGSTFYDVEKALQLGGFDRYFHEEHIAVQPLPFSTLDESYPMINGRGYPDTTNTAAVANASVQDRLGLAEPYPSQPLNALIRATQGQYILLRISNVSLSDFHTITVLGIPARVVGKDANLLRGPTGLDLSYETTSFTFGGGETVDMILDTTNVAPGTYFLYDSRLNHLSNDEEDYGGMMTEIIIGAP